MPSQKERDFIRSPLFNGRDLPMVIGDVGGINGEAVLILNNNGFIYAHQLLGQFLLLNRDYDAFTDWLVNLFRNNGYKHQDRYITSAYNSLKGWTDNV